MFFRLVYIELIRLVKNRSLKLSAFAGLFFVICSSVVVSYGVERMIDLNFYPGMEQSTSQVLATIYMTYYLVAVCLVTIVTTVFTTCDYSKYRLAVNIEGMARNRFILYLSEIAGIMLFTIILVLSGVILALLVNLSADKFSVNSFADLKDNLIVYLGSATMFYSIARILATIGYLVSRVFKSKAVAFSILGCTIIYYAIITAVSIGFVRGSNLDSAYNVSFENLVGALALILVIIPVVVWIVVLFFVERKRDRI